MNGSKIFPSSAKLILALGSVLTLESGLLFATTEVCGTFHLAAEWTARESPYLVTGDIFIPANSRLRIGPGVTVRFGRPRPCPSDTAPQPLVDWSDSSYTGIKSEGTFYSLGTEEKPVVFEPEASKPGIIGWDGIRISGQNAQASEICFSHFRGANQAVQVSKAGFFIHHNLFIGNNTGVLLGLRGDVIIVNCNFIDNLSAGIVTKKAGPRIANNIFLNNRSYGIWADARPAIQIQNNAFWGNREQACRKCPYQVLQRGKLNTNKDTTDSFGNLEEDPIFLGTPSFDSARQADLRTDTPAHLVKDPKLAEMESKARKENKSTKDFMALGEGDYLLSEYSKLTDAGYKSRELKDRDNSQNDIGLHGGPMTRIIKDPF
jgi:hypothetical protein